MTFHRLQSHVTKTKSLCCMQWVRNCHIGIVHNLTNYHASRPPLLLLQPSDQAGRLSSHMTHQSKTRHSFVLTVRVRRKVIGVHHPVASLKCPRFSPKILQSDHTRQARRKYITRLEVRSKKFKSPSGPQIPGESK